MTDPMRACFAFHIDPGHGWLEVPRSTVIALGILDEITRYSYELGDRVFLEEDCDLSTFAKAAEAQGFEWGLREIHHDDDAKLRGFPRFAARSWSANSR